VADLKGIPIQVERRPAKSGEKFVTPQGFTAIRDGIKKSAGSLPFAPGQKPRWLRAPLAAGARYEMLRQTVREHRLSTVCEEAHCPNIGECWNAARRRSCSWVGVHARLPLLRGDTGNPRGWLDPDEPANAAARFS
jgi:lipoic acid synthetase